MPKIQSPQAQGLGFAGKVSERADKWADFGKLRADFLKLDSPKAREVALDALKNGGDADLRQFANALADATGAAKKEAPAAVIAQRPTAAVGESGGGYTSSAG